MQHLEATATDVPINQIVTEGEDIIGVDNAAEVVVTGHGQLTEKETVLRNISVGIWRPWLTPSQKQNISEQQTGARSHDISQMKLPCG